MGGQQSIKRSKKRKRKKKGIADIVFCLANSSGMAPAVYYIKDYIRCFIDGLKLDIDYIDYRLGILAHSCSQDIKFYRLDFVKDLFRFKSALRSFETGKQEITLPAIDWSLDFDWRKATRIVISFTDEPLDWGSVTQAGYEPDLQRSKLEELIRKIGNLHVYLYFIGPRCEEYSELANAPRTNGDLFEFREDRNIDKFGSYNFDNLIKKMAKTLSHSLNQQSDVVNKNKDLYNLKSKIILKNL